MRWPASRNATLPSMTVKYTGFGDRPVTTMPSMPANLRLAGKNPPDWESPMVPVKGDLALTLTRLWPEIKAPVTTLAITVRTFSGASGSTPMGVSLRM